MEVLVSAVGCLGACVKELCCGAKKGSLSMAQVKYSMHNKTLPTSRSDWEKYLNEGGEL